MGLAVVAQGQDARSVRPYGEWRWQGAVAAPQGWFEGSSWRDWVSTPMRGQAWKDRRGRIVPGATVEVIARSRESFEAQARELNLAFAPVSRYAFQAGAACSITSQMLSEFMGMYGSNFHPPTVPSVWYNQFISYEMQLELQKKSGAIPGAGVATQPIVGSGRR